VLTVSLPSEPIFADGDPARIEQILGNLLSNARKFTDGGGRIGIAVVQERNEAIISVSDNGIGMDATHLSRIFELFSQIDSSLERSINGLGIGLTLVRKLAEMHAGSVEAFSLGVGHGSKFVVRLPVAAPIDTQPLEPIFVAPIVSIRRRILVVDDNRDSANSLAMLLELLGHETQKAYDGLEAMDRAVIFRPDVILLDIGLPKLNGYEVCRRVRDQAWGKSIEVIGLSGWGRDKHREMSTGAAFDAHFIKPVDFDALTKLLAQTNIRSGATSELN
jgi:CheY-like chemotaxis protein